MHLFAHLLRRFPKVLLWTIAGAALGYWTGLAIEADAYLNGAPPLFSIAVGAAVGALGGIIEILLFSPAETLQKTAIPRRGPSLSGRLPAFFSHWAFRFRSFIQSTDRQRGRSSSYWTE